MNKSQTPQRGWVMGGPEDTARVPRVVPLHLSLPGKWSLVGVVPLISRGFHAP